MIIIIFSSSFSTILKLLVSKRFHENAACNIFEKIFWFIFGNFGVLRQKSPFQKILQATRSCQLNTNSVYIKLNPKDKYFL